jgi:membrane dipeptidase
MVNVIGLGIVGLSLASVFGSIGIVSWWLLKALHPTTPKPMTPRQKQLAPIIIAVSFGVFFFYAPVALDSAVNTVDLIGTLPPVTTEAQDLFASLWIGDTNAETLLWPTRDLHKYNDLGHVDIPRLIEGNIALQGFSVVTRVWLFAADAGVSEPPKGVTDAVAIKAVAEMWGVWPVFSLPERALYQMHRLDALEKSSNGTFRFIKTKQELINYEEARKLNKKMTAGYLTVKGLHVIGKSLANIDKLINGGARVMSLVTMFDNEIAGSAQGQAKLGLTPFGRKVVDRLVKNKIIIDVSHASDLALDDLESIFNASFPVPLISSASGVDKVCQHHRNLKDKYIKLIARSGGFVSISFYSPFVCGDDHVASIIQSIRYVVKLVGAKHVALGSGFDSMHSTPIDASGMKYIVQGLIDAGISKADIALVMGENVKNLLANNLP